MDREHNEAHVLRFQTPKELRTAKFGKPFHRVWGQHRFVDVIHNVGNDGIHNFRKKHLLFV
jgi:hypothetical protein